MGIIGWTWVIVGLSFAISMAVAVWARARSTSAYYVAEEQVSPVTNGMATAADWMSAATFLSMAGLVASRGRDGSAYLVGWTGGYVLLAVLIAPYLRKYGKFTVPQFVGERYYSKGARAVALLCALVVTFTYAAGQMRGVAIVLARFLDVPIAAAVWIGVAVVFVYTITGGMKNLTYTQVAQYVVLIVAYVVPAVFVALLLTGRLVPQVGFGSVLTPGAAERLGVDPGRHLLEALNGIHADLGFARYTDGWRPRVDVLATTVALMVGTAGLPHIVIRFFTVPKIRDARASAAWALVFIAVLYTTAPAVAAFARLGQLGTVHGRPYAEAPSWFTSWERAGLARFQDLNGDGRMQYSGDPRANEVEVDSDVLTLATPEMLELPPWVVALVAAGALAAAAATAAGLMLVVSATVAHDLLKGVLAPRMSERSELRWSRLAAAGALLGAGWLGANPPATVAQVVAYAFGFAASSFFPVLVLGIFWRRATKEGAIAGMLAGLGFTAAYVTWFELVAPARNVPEAWWFGISPEGIGAVGMLLNAAVLVVVSRLTTAPPAEVQEMVAALRLPRAAPGVGSRAGGAVRWPG
jgi:cation/acetate symporter